MPNRILLLAPALLAACAQSADDYGASIVGGVVGVSAYVDRQLASSTAFEVPFDAGTKGDVQVKQFGVERENQYALALRLRYDDRGPDERERVARIVGAGPGGPGFGSGFGAGAAIPVRVRIAQVRGGAFVPMYDLSGPDHSLDRAEGGAYRRGIGVVHLPPGLYQMSIEAEADVPALRYVRVTFAMAPADG